MKSKGEGVYPVFAGTNSDPIDKFNKLRLPWDGRT
jgi:hypothetical protein